VEKVHAAGKEAMMFWGDNWIGAEPYGKYFSRIGLDAVVGSVSSGATVRAVSDIPNLKYKEIRLMPYFFPDTLNDDGQATEALLKNWAVERRALLRRLVDRIGFGGYLRLADRLPKFCGEVERVCDEFRDICEVLSSGTPYEPLKVCVLSYWGKEKSWMTNMICQDAPFQHTARYLGCLESLAGLPVDLHFVSFSEAKKGALSSFDVVINCGGADTSFSGGACWKDPELVACVREYVAGGGGFIGIGEPSAVQYSGRFFQLADLLGVEKERGFTGLFLKHNVQVNADHFIMRDAQGEVDDAGGVDLVFALPSAQILAARSSRFLPEGVNNCHVKLAVNEYGKGRSFYASGLAYNASNTRILYRALLWCAHKEELLKRAFAENRQVECHYYPAAKKYALVNQTDSPQESVFYTIDGKLRKVELSAGQLLWVSEA
ncbi:MAG: 1,3-beta-galactosyl-N-acetylhexosamine phosphorylase, partial [Clostridia bacterium]|nr:1,3-beta-galactosyl-N-acetylhexosamine phosphorylase [Clostridia bacterium]